jgi:spermidine synthase
MTAPWHHRAAIGILFFVSGFTALIYEILWIREFAFLLGSSTYTISVVIAAYMAGLAAGSVAAGRIAGGSKNPLLAYAALEAGIGVCGLWIYWLLEHGLRAMGPLGTGSQAGFIPVLLRFVISFAVLLPPTAMMGATLPFLTRFFPAGGKKDGGFLGLLYGINTLGAAAGCFITGFFFLRLFGMQKATYLAVQLNFLIALSALLLGLWLKPVAGMRQGFVPEIKSGAYSSATANFMLAAFAISGFSCMAYELIYFRWLSYILGNRVYASSAMITTFLTGIAIGSLIAGRLADKWGNEVRFFGILQTLTGLTAVFTAVFFPDILEAMRVFEQGLKPADPWQYVLVRFGEAFIILFIPAVSFGAIFPTVIKYLNREKGELSGIVGRAYGVNTIGCIAGSLAAGFLILPALGAYASMAVIAALSILLGHRMLEPDMEGCTARKRIMPVALTLMLAASLLLLFFSAGRYPWPRKGLTLVAAKEDATALVAMYTGPLGSYIFADDTMLSFPIGPRTKAVAVQKLQAHIPLLLHPDPKKVLVIGAGFGVTAGSFASDKNVEKVECVEIFPALLDMMPLFGEANRNVAGDKKVKLIAGDGRYYMRHSTGKYDIIASNLTGSDLPGSASCYTKEYFEAARDKLGKGGIFLVHSFGPDSVVVLKTLMSVFPYVEIYRAYSHTRYMLATLEPIALQEQQVNIRIMSDSVFRRDLQKAGVWNYNDLKKMLIMDHAAAKREANVLQSPLNTDDLPVLEYRFKSRNQDMFVSRL